MNTKSKFDNYIVFYYLSGPLQSEDIEQIRSVFNEFELGIRVIDRNGVYVANAEEFSNVVSLVINTPLLVNLLKDIGPNAIWDAIKITSIYAWNKSKGLRYTKLYTRGRVEEKPITIGIEVKLDPATSYNFRFDGLNNEQELSIALDKALEFLRGESKQKQAHTTYLATFNSHEEKWELRDLLKEIKERLDEGKL